MNQEPNPRIATAREAVLKQAELYSGVAGANQLAVFDLLLAGAEATISDSASDLEVAERFAMTAKTVCSIFLLRRGLRRFEASQPETIDAPASDIAV